MVALNVNKKGELMYMKYEIIGAGYIEYSMWDLFLFSEDLYSRHIILREKYDSVKNKKI